MNETVPSPLTVRAEEEQAVLTDLAVTAGKHGMYPRDHPQLRAVAERLSARLGGILAERGTLALGVGLDALLVDGESVEPCPPMVRDFARRLRHHQIGAVTFHDGINWSELERFFSALSADPATSPAIDAAPFGPNLLVGCAGYGRIALSDAEPSAADGPDPEALWAELAQAALDDPAGGAPAALAAALDRSGHGSRLAERAGRCLARILEALGTQRNGGHDHAVGLRVSDLLRRIRPETLRSLLWLNGDAAARAALLRSAAPALASDVLAPLIRAAAEASERDVSQTVLRLLGKISAQMDASDVIAARLAGTELKAGIERLLTDWQLTDPNPERYNALLDEAAFGAAQARGTADMPQIGVDERILRISLDLGQWTATAERAVARLLDAGEALLLLRLLDEAGDSRAGHSLAQCVLTPRTILILTEGEQVDPALLDRTARAMGSAAIRPLLGVLANSRSRSMRRTVFDILAELGPDVAVAASGWLNDENWYVRRNMLDLIARTGSVPASFDVLRLVSDPDHRVRIKALAVVAGHPDEAEAFARALQDEEPRVVVAALRNPPDALPARCSEPLHRIAAGDASETSRILAVRNLGRIRTAEACHALIQIASPGRNWFGRVRIRHDSAALEAVRALARSWSGDRAVRPVIRAAARIKDADVRSAPGAGT